MNVSLKQTTLRKWAQTEGTEAKHLFHNIGQQIQSAIITCVTVAVVNQFEMSICYQIESKKVDISYHTNIELTAPDDFLPQIKKFIRNPPPHIIAGYKQLVCKH